MTIRLKGNFLTGNPAEEFRDVVTDSLQELVELGEEMLSERLRPRPSGVYLSVAEAQPGKASTGNYRRAIEGHVRDNLTADITDGNVVYGPWLEGVGSRNATTRFKGYRSFRVVRDKLEAKAESVVAKHVSKFVGRMNS